MKRALLLTGLVICWFSGLLFAGDSWSLDLSEHGYIQPPMKRIEKPHIAAISRYVDFDAEGNVFVGFVVGDKPAHPDTPQFISRSWRIVKLTSAGKFLFTKDFSTMSWDDNGIYGAAGGNFLVRTINSLKLISGEGELLIERVLPAIRNGYNLSWIVQPSPSREKIYLKEKLLEVLNSKNLSLITSCGFGKSHPLELLSEDSMLVKGPSRLGRYDLGYEIGKVCETPEWRYDVELGGPSPWALLDQSRTVAIHRETLILQEHGREKWRLKFERKKGEGIGNYILSDQSGNVFALRLRKIVGGSDFFDTNGKVAEARIMVIRSHDGKILVEAPIKPVESISPVQDFAVSRDGKYLAIMDEGELRVVSIPSGMDGNGLESNNTPKSIEPANTNGAP